MFKTFRMACAAIVASLCLVLPASAITITLAGVDYEIVFLNSNSYTSNAATLSDPALTPWFGSDADASSAATQIAAQNGDLPPGVTQAWVVRDASTFVYYTTGLNTTNSGGYPAGAALPNAGTVWVTTGGAIVAVPEIGGNALAKALFVLLAFGLWLKSRRRNAIAWTGVPFRTGRTPRHGDVHSGKRSQTAAPTMISGAPPDEMRTASAATS